MDIGAEDEAWLVPGEETERFRDHELPATDVRLPGQTHDEVQDQQVGKGDLDRMRVLLDVEGDLQDLAHRVDEELLLPAQPCQCRSTPLNTAPRPRTDTHTAPAPPPSAAPPRPSATPSRRSPGRTHPPGTPSR